MEKRRCQVGDLAITAGTDLPENAGLIVEVLAVHLDDPTWGAENGPLCLVRNAGSRPLHLSVLIQGQWLRRIVRQAIVPDSRLQPITPPGREALHSEDEIDACRHAHRVTPGDT